MPATAALGGAGLRLTARDRDTASTSSADAGDDLLEPEVLASRDGLLDTGLVAAPAQVRIGERHVWLMQVVDEKMADPTSGTWSTSPLSAASPSALRSATSSAGPSITVTSSTTETSG